MATAQMDTARLPRSKRRLSQAWDRGFFSLMAMLMLATVLFGFARTYFLAGMIRAPLPNRLIHIHGAAFTAWILLLLVQTALITAGSVRLHRKLGVIGFLLAVSMVVLGSLAAVDAMRRGGTPLGLDTQTFFIIPISDMVLFSLFVAYAYRLRFKPEAHKRLILIATIALMDAGIGRWPILILQQKPFLQDFVLYAYLLLIVIYDRVSLDRFSKTTLWASAAFVLVHASRVTLGFTPAWHSFTSFVLRHA